MQIIGGFFGFIVLMAIISAVAPALGHLFEALFGLGAMAVVAYVLFLIASAGSRAVQKGAEVADYLLVQHPAEPIVNSALRRGKELDTIALQDALTPTISELALGKPLYHYKNQTKKARALKEKLDEDASLAQAAIRRERARDAERE